MATAFGVKLGELKKAGLAGVSPFLRASWCRLSLAPWQYCSAIRIRQPLPPSAPVVTYIVGPVTGAIGASDAVITLSVAAGLVKSILVMIGTPVWRARLG